MNTLLTSFALLGAALAAAGVAVADCHGTPKSVGFCVNPPGPLPGPIAVQAPLPAPVHDALQALYGMSVCPPACGSTLGTVADGAEGATCERTQMVCLNFDREEPPPR